MAGLFLVHTRDPDFALLASAMAREQFARHGFPAAREHDLLGWRMLHSPYIFGGPETFLTEGDDLIAYAGTLTYDGLIGERALAALLAAVEPPAVDWSRIGGHFVAVVRKRGRTFVFGDRFAAFQLFYDTERRIFSTSLLAAARALPRVRFDPQGVYEFAFNVMPIGDDTIFADVKTLGPGAVVELTAAGSTIYRNPTPLPERVVKQPIADRIAEHRERLAATVGSYTAHFGDRIHCPLSGGLDSRLVLGALRSLGSAPQVYVYGGPADPDVMIAEAIGRAEGFPVECVDKLGFRHLDPDAFPELVERNFQEFDALPTYGNIFDDGINARARDARHANGDLAVSGGCGEIFRNFFYLTDRPISAAAVARTFFARYDQRDVTEMFEPIEFLRALEDKILAALERPGDRAPLPRPVVEQIYPRVRCRALFGREISLEARYSPYFMPFLEHQVVAKAVTLPMSLKHVGRFEAMLLNEVDPTLAAHQSAYGHTFAGPPSVSHRFGEWSSRIRPVWFRQRSYAIQRRLRPMNDEHGGLLAPEYMDRVIDPEFPAMRRFFKMENVGDAGMWRRLACLEYLAARLGGQLQN